MMFAASFLFLFFSSVAVVAVVVVAFCTTLDFTVNPNIIILDPQDLLVSVFNSNISIIIARCEKITLERVRGVAYLH